MQLEEAPLDVPRSQLESSATGCPPVQVTVVLPAESAASVPTALPEPSLIVSVAPVAVIGPDIVRQVLLAFLSVTLIAKVVISRDEIVFTPFA